MVTCKCENCNNLNCTCECADSLSCDCEGCGVKVEAKVVNPSERFHCEGCGG